MIASAGVIDNFRSLLGTSLVRDAQRHGHGVILPCRNYQLSLDSLSAEQSSSGASSLHSLIGH